MNKTEEGYVRQFDASNVNHLREFIIETFDGVYNTSDHARIDEVVIGVLEKIRKS